MKKLLALATILIISITVLGGCSGSSNDTDTEKSFQTANEGDYRKVSLYADITLSHLPSADMGEGLLVCLGQGTLSSIMYFDKYGGDVIEQESSLSISSINCENFGTAEPCTAWSTPAEPTASIQLEASLTPEAIKYVSEDGKENLKDQLTFRIPSPVTDSIDITYACSGPEATMSDYGATFSQLAVPFLTTLWDFPISISEPKISTIKEFESFNNKATIEFGILEEFVDTVPAP